MTVATPTQSRHKAPPRARRQARKRAQILEAASRIFARRVYHQVTMDEIARESHVGKGTLYRYFPSKEDLYLAIVDQAFELLIQRLEAEHGAESPPTVTLGRMIEAMSRPSPGTSPSSGWSTEARAASFSERSR